MYLYAWTSITAGKMKLPLALISVWMFDQAKLSFDSLSSEMANAIWGQCSGGALCLWRILFFCPIWSVPMVSVWDVKHG